MKKSKLLSYMMFILALITVKNLAQNNATATWPLSNPGTGGTGFAASTSGVITAADELFKGTEINGYTGTNNSQRIRMAGTGNTWAANLTNQIDTVYVQFSVSPKKGAAINVKNISLSIGAASTQTIKANIYYSASPDFSNPVPVQYSTGNASNYLLSTALTDVTASVDVNIPDGGTFYLRLYPWHVNSSVSTGKYMVLQNVEISGITSGIVIADPPSISTTSATYISTTFFTSGGKITTDGGGAVTARGVCWNTTGQPTIANNKTSDGTGVGSFVSKPTGLTAGVKYYLRAYATNSSGTAYGEEISVTTLASVSVPTVTTTSVSSVLVTTAQSGGNVSDWGGAEVTARGICWSANSNPTISDSKTENGNDIGSFVSALSGLKENTKYYVRAYAVNSVGTGYGNEISFTTQLPAQPITKIVAADGSGDYTTVQAAFDAVPSNFTGTYTILIKNGTYKEKLKLASGKVNVVIRGESRDNTILTYDDYSGRVVNGVTLGTSTSESFSLQANDVVIRNITIQNTSHDQGQAVALNVTGDRIALYDVNLLGYQDTYYTWNSGRIYHYNCLIQGTVDFIFGNGVAVFNNCTIKAIRNSGTLTAASTAENLKFGYVFMNCKITSDAIGYDGNPISLFSLGRPWQNSPRTVFIKCEEPANLNPAGWLTWNVIPALYAEYQCYGPGSNTANRISAISRQLTDLEAAEYTLENIFSKNTSPSFGFDWMPEMLTSVEYDKTTGQVIPDYYELNQNYPNPFNPNTKIQFALPKTSDVKLEVFDILGRKIATLVNEIKTAGVHSVNFNAERLSSGLYIYRLSSAENILTKKMLLLK